MHCEFESTLGTGLGTDPWHPVALHCVFGETNGERARRLNSSDFGGGEDFGEVVVDEVADAVDVDVAEGVGGEDFGVEGVMALAGEDGGELWAPDFFDGVEDAELVVDEDVVVGGVAVFHVVEHFFLVDVDEDVAFDGFVDAGALDFAGLENDIAIGEDDGGAPLFDVIDGVDRVGIEAVGEGVIDKEGRHGEEACVAGVFDAVALESAEVVGVAEFFAEGFENFEVADAGAVAEVFFEVAREVFADAVVVEEGVVDIEKEDHLMAFAHGNSY